ncbi:hypothetical protein CBOM_07913 [Ceraceosorus bombacis]|uniref:Uncharacterized protein n=1 Tax=Ceraceosorus bombacis TaxID=401625 RepID=A0A0P1BQJ2_9BASI|nr:hypothetical protein CBOM_07913 [Ceraceosorus bombacis]
MEACVTTISPLCIPTSTPPGPAAQAQRSLLEQALQATAPPNHPRLTMRARRIGSVGEEFRTPQHPLPHPLGLVLHFSHCPSHSFRTITRAQYAVLIGH